MDYYQPDPDDARFHAYRSNVTQFIQEILSAAVIDISDYVPGTRRIDFWEELIENVTGFRVYDYKRAKTKFGPYEEALYQRVVSPNADLLVLIGGLGAGKSTTVRHLCATIEERRPDLAQSYHCSCNPCVRHPIIIDCLDIDRTFTINECEAEVLMRIRREVYKQLLDEWFIHNAEDPKELTGEDRKILRRLIIANDIYHWADSEALEFPASLHTDALRLPYDLLTFSPRDWNVRSLVSDHEHSANALDIAFQTVIANVGLSKRFTSLIIGFWLRSCNPRSPNNLIVVDNLDQQPTDHIEQITNHLHDLDMRHRGLRILLPLRPSSIVPHGFTKNSSYMYHYGPNCFDMIYRRLYRNVLSKTRNELMAALGHPRPFMTQPSSEEIVTFLVTTYIYALICIRGMHGDVGHDEDSMRPALHDDLAFLHRVTFSGEAIQHLADTLEAVVGTCGRYATDQLRRYYDHVYTHHAFLRQIEAAGLVKGAAARIGIPFGQIISAVLGVHGADAGLTGLANLYSATQVRANSKLPTLAKLRVLSFLAVRFRVRVHDVVAELAQYGIPWEISVGALNYLHEKNRLLLWFSRNDDLSTSAPDLLQYVVISEHGQTYLRDLVGDFEYIWFCAQQIVAVGTSDNMLDIGQNFITRLHDYVRLLKDFARIEWVQMTLRRCAAGTVWAPPMEEVRGDEMLTLFILYSSLERALRSAAVPIKTHRIRPDAQYVEDIVGMIDALIDLILTGQEVYEIYYGSNGYLKTYARKIEESRAEVARLRGNPAFATIAAKLDDLLNTWLRPVAPLAMDIKTDGSPARRDWEEFVKSITVDRPDERHAREVMLATLAPLLRRREELRSMLECRFPAYGVVSHQLALLVEEMKVVRDAAEGLAAYAAPFLKWLEIEFAALEDIRETLKLNGFRIPDVPSMVDMDSVKERANNISTAFVVLAKRLGIKRADHLAIHWSV